MCLKTKLVVSMAAVCIGASAAALGQGGSGDRAVTYIEVMADGSLLVEAEGGWANPDGCADPFRIFVPTSNPFLDRYYAAILSGYSGGNKVWAWLSGCQTMAWGEEYPIVKNVATRRN